MNEAIEMSVFTSEASTDQSTDGPSSDHATDDVDVNDLGPPTCTIIATFTVPGPSGGDPTYDWKISFSHDRLTNESIRSGLAAQLTELDTHMFWQPASDSCGLKSRWIWECEEIAKCFPDKERLVQYNVIKDITVEDRSVALPSIEGAVSSVRTTKGSLSQKLKGALGLRDNPEADFEDFVAPRRTGRPRS